MKLVGLDLEIGNPFETEDEKRWPEENSWLTEIGMALYDTDMGEQPVLTYNFLINEGKGVSKDAEEYTGISPALIEKYGKKPEEIVNQIVEFLKLGDFIVAHNGERADRPWLKHFLIRHLGIDKLKELGPLNWIDSSTDIEFPKNCRAKSLMYLTSFHEFANPFPHRALTDVMSMMKVFFKYPLDRIVEISKSERIILVARELEEMEGGDFNYRKLFFKKGTKEFDLLESHKSKLKKLGFRWDPTGDECGFEKSWFKETRRIFLENIKKDFNRFFIIDNKGVRDDQTNSDSTSGTEGPF